MCSSVNPSTTFMHRSYGRTSCLSGHMPLHCDRHGSRDTWGRCAIGQRELLPTQGGMERCIGVIKSRWLRAKLLASVQYMHEVCSCARIPWGQACHTHSGTTNTIRTTSTKYGPSATFGTTSSKCPAISTSYARPQFAQVLECTGSSRVGPLVRHVFSPARAATALLRSRAAPASTSATATR